MNARTADRDRETRQRVLEAATRLFVERGFEDVTVRDICAEAGANLASVNYHFGDKLRLYMAVVQSAIDQVRGQQDEMMKSDQRLEAGARLREFIHQFIGRVVKMERAAWVQKLFHHELSNSTEAASMIVDQVIRPRLSFLSAIVRELLGDAATDERVEQCVMSIHSQCLFYSPNKIRTLCFSASPTTPEEIERVAEHIFAFSLAGIQTLKQAKGAQEARTFRHPRFPSPRKG